MSTTAEFAGLVVRAQRAYALAIAERLQGPLCCRVTRRDIDDIGERLSLAIHTASGGCLNTACRMLEGIVT